MQISDLLGHYMNAAGSQAEPITKKKGVERFSSSVSELEKGNVFEGTVNSIKGKTVVLGLSNGQQITARLDAKMTLQPGQSMFFQVKSNEGNLVAIRPFTVDGTGANLTLLEALKEASLPTSEEHLAMVNKMMEEHMPIDRNSLNAMAKLMQSNPDIDVKTLVQLKKLELPMNIEFATQFENYLGDKQAITTALDEFMETLPEALSNEQLSSDVLTKMEADILSIVTENLSKEIEIPKQMIGNQMELVADELLSDANGERPTVNSTESEMVKSDVFSPMPDSEEAENLSKSDLVKNTSKSDVMDVIGGLFKFDGTESASHISGSKMNVNPSLDSLPDGKAMLQELMNGKSLVAPNSLGSVLSEEQQQYLKGQLQVLFSEANQEYDVSKLNKDTSVVSVLKDIQELLANNPQMGKKVLLEFFSGNECKALIKDALEQQWTVRPKDLEGSDKINRLYEKLEHQLTRMEEVVKATGQQEHPVIQLSENIRSNVEFMKQINEMYTYVQVPLKMSGQNASGQIYVYTNKKKQQKVDEDLTAFLHLDMEHLGQTDVSVRMHGKDVTTNFYMENDASYALIKQFMPQLEARLLAKGYKCSLNVTNESRNVNFVEDFLKRDQPSAGQVRRYSFDMRA